MQCEVCGSCNVRESGTCSTCYAREWRRKNKDKAKNNDLKKEYGITLAQYEEMEILQDFKCAICGKPEKDICKKKEGVRRLAVDHCHTTGKIRGLLCRGCNQGLGNFKDNIQSLQKAIEYLMSTTSP